MKKHTPGPWFFTDGSRQLQGREGQWVGDCLVGSTEDAHLIAAAPDLLEALEAVACVISVMDSPITEISILPLEVAKQVAAAIAKAKGES